jgi:hypothetical protein
MIFPGALTAPLAALTAALDDPGTDLQAILEVLCDDLSAAVSSFLGLTMTVQVDGIAVTLTAIDEDSALTAGATLQLPLNSCTVVFYAGHPGAFVDLAADAQRLCGPDGRVVLDGDLPGTADPPRPSGIIGLAELSVINQAVGVQISRGYTPAQAHAELRRLAAGTLHSVPAAAGHVLASTNAPPYATTAPVSTAGQC